MISTRRYCGEIALAAALLLPGGAASGFALLGPNPDTDGFGGNADPVEGVFQPHSAGFRWSSSAIKYSIDQSFIDAYGAAGVQAVHNAFATWDAAFGAVNPAQTNHSVSVEGRETHDLETVALHEIGHALGLHHPDQDLNTNFDPAGNDRVATGNELMAQTVDTNEIQRRLMQDDLDGLTYLYGQNTTFKTLNASADALIDLVGPGDLLLFFEAAVASSGPLAGANIDIFADDLGAGNILDKAPLAETRIWGGARTAGDTTVDVGTGDVKLGGTFDGVPLDLSAHPTFPIEVPFAGDDLTSIDIVFNTNDVYKLGVIPEPSTAPLLALGLTALAARGRSARSSRNR